MLDSLLMAFSLYSKIPVPQRQWNDKSMKYCICFLPLVGAVIGVLQYFAFILLQRLSLGAVFRGAVLSALPILVTGGIHMDGYLDTCDAIHSYGSREKKLEILKDPHVGAFAVMGGIVYFVLSLGVWSEAGWARMRTESPAGSTTPQSANQRSGATRLPAPVHWQMYPLRLWQELRCSQAA